MFLGLVILTSILLLPLTVFSQAYHIERFGPDSVIANSNSVNVEGIASIKIGFGQWYVFLATFGDANGYVWRYDTRNKEWKQFNSSNGLDLFLGAALAIIVGKNNRLLVSGDGIWVSDNFGESWRFIQGLPSAVFRAFAKGNDDVLYAAGEGVFRSTDNGETWTCILPKDSINIHRQYMTSLAIMPSGAILVGVGAFWDDSYGKVPGGIFKSTDGGKTWFHSEAGLDYLPNGRDTLPNVTHLATVGGSSPVVFAKTTRGGVYRSRDEGAHWQRLEGYPLPDVGGFDAGLNFFPAGLFAGIDSGYGHRRLFRSLDEGESFTEIVGFGDYLPKCFGSTEPNIVIMGTDDFAFLITFENPQRVEDKGIPTTYQLFQNYPNPFNPTTTIMFDIPQRSFVKLAIYDVLGREVKTAVDEEKAPGRYEVNFSGAELPSGIYFYKLTAGQFSAVRNMVLIR